MNHDYYAIGDNDFKCANCSLVKSGNIVVDEFGPEEPQEMISIYYDDTKYYFTEPSCSDILLKGILE